MQFIFDLINRYIFSYVLRFINSFCNNKFALSIFLFTLFINVLLIPLNIKSQKASVQQTKIKPKLDELKKKYGDDKQKYNTAMQQLYQEENVSMSGGCLPLILRFVLLLSIFYLIISPVTYLTNVDKQALSSVTEVFSQKDGEYSDYFKTHKPYNNSYELPIISFVNDEKQMASVKDETLKANLETIKQEVEKIDFDFFGINLTQTPTFSFNFSEANKLWIIPFLSFAAAMISGLISSRLQKAVNPDAPNMMGMLLLMPFVSLFIAFKAPGGLGFYWACSSIITGGIQAAIQYFYGPHKMLAKERAKNLIKCHEQESKILSSDNSK